jgi:hypothetical protein
MAATRRIAPAALAARPRQWPDQRPCSLSKAYPRSAFDMTLSLAIVV